MSSRCFLSQSYLIEPEPNPVKNPAPISIGALAGFLTPPAAFVEELAIGAMKSRRRNKILSFQAVDVGLDCFE